MNLRMVRAKSAEESNSNTSIYPFCWTATGEKPVPIRGSLPILGPKNLPHRMLSLAAFGISDDEAHHDQKLKKKCPPSDKVEIRCLIFNDLQS
jgi:hypothetical protein